MTPPDSIDQRISIHGETIFLRRWHVGDGDAAPIVLLHDSLGSVAQWRDFPAHLAQATARDVIASVKNVSARKKEAFDIKAACTWIYSYYDGIRKHRAQGSRTALFVRYEDLVGGTLDQVAPQHAALQALHQLRDGSA